MYTAETPDQRPEETPKKKNRETAPESPPVQSDETSRSITPPDPDKVPKDTVRDAKERWDTESPAVKGHPQQQLPEDVNAEENENPDGDDEDLLKKRDETGVA